MLAASQKGRGRHERLDVSAFIVPTDFSEADGTISVVVEATGGGICRLGYTYADTATALLV